jgi:hypothetical protein
MSSGSEGRIRGGRSCGSMENGQPSLGKLANWVNGQLEA